jgi:hypothetical protein
MHEHSVNGWMGTVLWMQEHGGSGVQEHSGSGSKCKRHLYIYEESYKESIRAP